MYVPYIKAVGTVGLIVFFDRENMAVILTGVIPKMAAIWRPLYCHSYPFSAPVENGF